MDIIFTQANNSDCKGCCQYCIKEDCNKRECNFSEEACRKLTNVTESQLEEINLYLSNYLKRLKNENS